MSLASTWWNVLDTSLGPPGSGLPGVLTELPMGGEAEAGAQSGGTKGAPGRGQRATVGAWTTGLCYRW